MLLQLGISVSSSLCYYCDKGTKSEEKQGAIVGQRFFSFSRTNKGFTMILNSPSADVRKPHRVIRSGRNLSVLVSVALHAWTLFTRFI